MLHEARNVPILDNSLVQEGLRELQRRLPPGWSVGELVREPQPAFVNATVEITSPDKKTGSIALEVRARFEPKAVRVLADSLRESQTRGAFVVLSRYLSESTRSLLKKSGIGYLDLTGNARIVVPKPGLYIETQGAAEDPDREERPARSLRGAKAGRIVRTLVDRKETPGVRELATITKIDAGYVSRVLAFLDTEALITRVGHGKMQSVQLACASTALGTGSTPGIAGPGEDLPRSSRTRCPRRSTRKVQKAVRRDRKPRCGNHCANRSGTSGDGLGSRRDRCRKRIWLATRRCGSERTACRAR